MTGLVLGQKVSFVTRLYRTEESRQEKWYGRTHTRHWRVWKPCPWSGTERKHGIVVGTRTLMNNRREYIGYEEGWDNNLGDAERFQAVMVATKLREKPVYVLPENLRSEEPVAVTREMLYAAMCDSCTEKIGPCASHKVAADMLYERMEKA